MVKPFKNKNPTYIGLLGWDLEERRDLSHPWMELFLWKRKNSFLDMNPGDEIWDWEDDEQDWTWRFFWSKNTV